jgi:rhodanese-related sulfurtransferase
MPIALHHRNEVRALIERAVQIVEVLGAKEFEEEHLPGAINISLRRIETQALTLLDRSRPVLVYCFDSA